jgi:hypothetical protein
MSTLTLETELYNVLSALCPRVFPDVAPEGTPEPYVVWHQYGGQAPMYVEGVMADRRNCYVQINVWHESRSVCNQLSLDIEAALVAHQAMQAQPLNAISATFDEDVSLRGAMQDFSLWVVR